MGKKTVLFAGRFGLGLACVAGFWLALGPRLTLPLWQVAILPTALAGGILCWRSRSSRMYLIAGALLLAILSAVAGEIVRQQAMLSAASERVEHLIPLGAESPAPSTQPRFSLRDAVLVWRDSLSERWGDFAMTLAASIVGALGAGHFAYHATNVKPVERTVEK